MSDLCSPSLMAKWFINRVDREAGEAMTPLKVQKLLYFAQAYYLANFEKPLFAEDFQAWAHGPVVPSIFQAYSEFRWEAIPPQEIDQEIDRDVAEYLEAVYQEFGKFSAKELERISHQHAPWLDVRGKLPPEARCTDVIKKSDIENFYAARIRKNKKSKK